MTRTPRVVRWTALRLIVLLAGGIAVLELHSRSLPATRNAAAGPVGVSDDVAIGGPFHLIDDQGRAVTDADYRGRWMLVFFGYSDCPDECPLTLQKMATALANLGLHEGSDQSAGDCDCEADPHRRCDEDQSRGGRRSCASCRGKEAERANHDAFRPEPPGQDWSERREHAHAQGRHGRQQAGCGVREPERGPDGPRLRSHGCDRRTPVDRDQHDRGG